MALKIKPEARKALESGSMETIKKLGKLGEKFKNYKYVQKYALEAENAKKRLN